VTNGFVAPMGRASPRLYLTASTSPMPCLTIRSPRPWWITSSARAIGSRRERRLRRLQHARNRRAGVPLNVPGLENRDLAQERSLVPVDAIAVEQRIALQRDEPGREAGSGGEAVDGDARERLRRVEHERCDVPPARGDEPGHAPDDLVLVVTENDGDARSIAGAERVGR
jgi:hypothetical protein